MDDPDKSTDPDVRFGIEILKSGVIGYFDDRLMTRLYGDCLG